jgi:hypothetical protein
MIQDKIRFYKRQVGWFMVNHGNPIPKPFINAQDKVPRPVDTAVQS